LNRYTTPLFMQQLPTSPSWTFVQKISFRFFSVFVLLFIFSFPIPYHYFPDPASWIAPLFETIAEWFGTSILGLNATSAFALLSDSTGLYVHVLVLTLISLISCIVWSSYDKRVEYQKALYWVSTIVTYYLAMQMFFYGFNKVFNWQFYLPEPNTLYTTVGDTPRDLLYWSSMGTSPVYSMFAGLTEVVAALLLLFRSTRLLGAIFTMGIMTNVVMINFGFDISVKLFSSFLLLLSIFIIAPDFKRLLAFFVQRETVQNERWVPQFSTKNKKFYWAGKAIVIWLMLFNVLANYFIQNNFNDDLAERPPLHGAYEVAAYSVNGETIAPLMTNNQRWKRMFIHRQGYFITQTMTDEMQDYKLQYDLPQQQLVIEDYYRKKTAVLNFELTSNEMLTLNGVVEGDTLNVVLKKLDHENLKLLKNEFHWTVD
jgi:hypothetical protein